MNYTLLALTALPLLGCILSASIENRAARNAVVVILSCLIMGIGAYFGINFVMSGCTPFVLEQDHHVIEKIAISVFGLEVILLAYIVWRGISAHKWTSPILAIIQFLGLVYFEFCLHPKFGAEFVSIDSLSMTLMMLVSIIGPLILIFAMGYMEEHEKHLHLKKTKQPQFFAIIFFFLFAMNALAMSSNLSWLCAFWEMTTLCSFLLIQHDKTPISIKNAFKTLDLNMVGGVAFTIGIIVLYTRYGVTSLGGLNTISGSFLILLPVALFCIAGMTKSAQFPFQKWLLGAMVAPTPVSALLHSSTMVNAGVYLILRMAPVMSGTILGKLVAVAGGFTFVAASALAISQSNGKKVLAYSTIANLGLIVCLAGLGTHASVCAGIFLMIFHALSKGMLFLSVGTIEQKIGSRDIEDMQGMLKIMPFTTIVLSLGIVSMLLPPFGVLVSKWIAIECAVSNPLVLIFIVLGSALTVVYYAKWLGIVTTSSYKERIPKEEIFGTTRFVLTVLVILVLLASICIVPLFNSVVSKGVFITYSPLSMTSQGNDIAISSMGNLVGNFGSIPFFAIMLLVVIFIPSFIKNLNPTNVRPPYTGGELADNDIRGIKFTGPGDKVEEIVVRNYYFNNLFSEEVLNIPLTTIALLVVLIILGVVL